MNRPFAQEGYTVQEREAHKFFLPKNDFGAVHRSVNLEDLVDAAKEYLVVKIDVDTAETETHKGLSFALIFIHPTGV